MTKAIALAFSAGVSLAYPAFSDERLELNRPTDLNEVVAFIEDSLMSEDAEYELGSKVPFFALVRAEALDDLRQNSLSKLGKVLGSFHIGEIKSLSFMFGANDESDANAPNEIVIVGETAAYCVEMTFTRNRWVAQIQDDNFCSTPLSPPNRGLAELRRVLNEFPLTWEISAWLIYGRHQTPIFLLHK